MRHSAELSVETCVLQYSTRSSWAAAATLVELSVLWYGIVYLSRTTDGPRNGWNWMARILPAASDGGGHELIVRSFAGILILASGVTSSKHDGDSSSSTSELDDHCEDRTTIIGERRRRHRFYSSFPPHIQVLTTYVEKGPFVTFTGFLQREIKLDFVFTSLLCCLLLPLGLWPLNPEYVSSTDKKWLPLSPSGRSVYAL